MCVCVHVWVFIHVQVHAERGREREGGREGAYLQVCTRKVVFHFYLSESHLHNERARQKGGGGGGGGGEETLNKRAICTMRELGRRRGEETLIKSSLMLLILP